MRQAIHEQYYPVPAYAKLPPGRDPESDRLGAGTGCKFAKRSVGAALATLAVVEDSDLPLQPFAADAPAWLLLFEAVLHLNSLDGPTGRYEAMVGRLAAGLPAREQAAAALALGAFLVADLAPPDAAALAANSEVTPGRHVLSTALLLCCHDVLLPTRAPAFGEVRLRGEPELSRREHDKHRQEHVELDSSLGAALGEPTEWSSALPHELWLAWPLARRAATAGDSTASLRRQGASVALSALKLVRLWAAGSGAVPSAHSGYVTSLESLKGEECLAPADSGSSSGGGGVQAGDALVAALAQQLFCVLASGWERRKGFDPTKVRAVLADLLLPPGASAADPGELPAPSHDALTQAAAQLGVRTCGNVSCVSLGGASEAKAKLQQCSGCAAVRCCGRECQLTDWPLHKRACKKSRKAAAADAPAAAAGQAGE